MKRLLLVSALTFAAAVGSGAWYSRYQAQFARGQRWQLQRAERAADTLLDKPMRLHGTQVTLEEFRQLIAVETGLDVEIDGAEIARLREQDPLSDYYRHIRRPPPAPPDISVLLPVGTFSIRGGIAYALEPEELACDLRGETLVITSAEAAEASTRTAVYPLPQPTLAATSELEWADLVETTIEPWDWDTVGGRGHLEAVPGALVVVHRPAIQRQVQQLLELLADLELRPDSLAPRSLPPILNTTERRHIVAALDQPAAISVLERPLDEVLATLARQHEVPIVIDSRRLEEAGVLTSTPVTKDLAGISLRSLLRRVLNELELTFIVRSAAIVVSTPEYAEAELPALIYPIRDLADASPNAAPAVGFHPPGSIEELIATTVAPSTWDDVGGPGSMQVFGKNWLIVTQTEEVHERIQSFLAQLRHGLAEGGEPRVLCPWSDTTAVRMIGAALERPLALDLDPVPLSEVCRRLTDQLGFNVTTDSKRITEIGVSVDQPITWHLPAVRLKCQLSWMLRDLSLMWVVRDDALVITTMEDAEGELLTRMYDVRSLTDPELGVPGGRRAVQSLIRRFVSPDSWDEVGGPGSMSDFRGMLIVCQTDEVHDQLGRFLEAIEKPLRPQLGSRNTPSLVPRTDLVRIDPSPTGLWLEQLLDRPVSLDYCGVPLADLLRDVGRSLDLPVVIDRAAVVVDGYDFQEPVSVSCRDRPLAAVLDELFEPRQFAYEIRDDVLFFTFKSRVSRNLMQPRLYAVDVLLPANGDTSWRGLRDRLIASDPAYWNERRSDSGAIQIGGNGWLIVLADWRKHQEVADWLEEQRTGQKPPRALQRVKSAAIQDRFEQIRLEAGLSGAP
jgi:hypothetical protein